MLLMTKKVGRISFSKVAYNVEAFMKLWHLENVRLAHAHSQIDAIS